MHIGRINRFKAELVFQSDSPKCFSFIWIIQDLQNANSNVAYIEWIAQLGSIPCHFIHRSDVACDDRKPHHLRFQNGHAKPFQGGGEEQKIAGRIRVLHFSVGQLGLRGVFNSQLLQHAMICVRGLSNDAKMNIQTLQRFGMTAQVFVLGNSDVQGNGFGLLGSAFRGLKCCGTTVGMTVIF